MTALERLQEVARYPAQVARAWRDGGGKVIGTRCLYVPEEVIWAAGALPYPLYGTPEPVRLADAYFQACTCELVRNIFDQALEGRLDFLSGLALCNTCDVVRHLCDLWGGYVRQTPVHLVNNPQRLGDEANREYWVAELSAFGGWLEGLTGQAPTEERLREAIRLHNRTRALLRRVTLLRQEEPSPISGAEAFEVSLAASVLPREEANALLTRLLEELRARPAVRRSGPRILVTGSLLDHPALLRMIEEEGGQVVVEDLCNTTRSFWQQADEGGDPWEAIRRLHDARPLCACTHPPEARYQHLGELAKVFRFDAVIDFTLKYCHPFLYEAPLLKRALAEQGLRTNVLEIGHDLSGHGQLRTRIQAYLEMLELEL